MKIYPTLTEYITSIEEIADNLEVDEFSLVPVRKANGDLYFTSGNFAVVFKLQDENTGHFYALKCFLRDVEHREESYRQIADMLEDVYSTYMARIHYLEDALWVDSSQSSDEYFSVLLMDWIEGDNLDTYIQSHRSNPTALAHLAYQFSLLSSWLLTQPFAHGDIKPDNIVVQPNGKMVLVDYDGMFVPSMRGQRQRESGTPHFQHPSRKSLPFDAHLDDFSLTSILLSLKLIAFDSSFLSCFGEKDRLLFTDSDYRNFGHCPALSVIMGYLGNPELQRIMSLFLYALQNTNLCGIDPAAIKLPKPGKHVDALPMSPIAPPSMWQNPSPIPPQSPQPSTSRTFTVKGVSFTMIFVEGGSFMMGATPEMEEGAYGDEKPVHKVTLPSYSIGETPVTQALWQAVMGSNPSKFTGNLHHPVEQVSWDDCQAFIQKLNTLTGVTFSLPTEAEWEFAARGGLKSKGFKYSGNNNLDNVAWYSSNSGSTTHPVKSKAPNELGLYDMTGNVWEWCQDYWQDPYPAAAQTNPKGPASGSGRVVRGASWHSVPQLCRVSYRPYDSPSFRDFNLGLRVVLR